MQIIKNHNNNFQTKELHSKIVLGVNREKFQS